MNDLAPSADFANSISASLLRLRMRSPFFGTLAMFARFIPSQTIPTAATDGRDIWLNPEFLQSLPASQQDGLILHEVLHAALLHPSRLGVREPELWNIAADIAINGMIAQQSGVEVPPGGLRDETLERLSVEEIYELLLPAGAKQFQLANPDLLAVDSGIDLDKSSPSERGQNPQADRQGDSLAAQWRHALQQATLIARTTQSGILPAGLDRELDVAIAPQLDWKTYLWRYLVQTPTDFQGFDRRLVSRGLYLETLQGESVRVYVAIDTSRSVRPAELQLLTEEVRGILGSYPHIECDLYYVDRDAHGPYSLSTDSDLPIPQGGGGTSFIPFFDRVDESWDGQTQAVCIYLTDGYGEFPSSPPALPTLWIVTPGGLDVAEFPFGEAVRLVGRG